MSDRVSTDHPGTEVIDRRHFIGMGALAVGGLTLADPLVRPALAAPKITTAVIEVFLSGGPSQIDTFDPKPGAPADYRGPFDAIPTNVKGIQVSEMFPLLAKQMDKFAIVRSVTHGQNGSSTAQHLTFTGFLPQTLPPTGNEHPSVGSVTAFIRGARKTGVPAYVNIPRVLPFAGAAFLPVTCEPFEVSDVGPGHAELRTIRPPIALDADRLAALSKMKIVLSGMQRIKGMKSTDLASFSKTAAQLATNPAILTALKVESESAAVRASYGLTPLGQQLLLARRLIEAGVTFVTVEDPGWAMDSNLEQQMSTKAPVLDRALAGLAADLSSRGLSKEVLLVVHGEFGRTAKMNAAKGRGNSGQVYSVLLGGGGLHTGLVIGSSDAKGEAVQQTLVGPEDVLATIYTALGIDPRIKVADASGKPTPILPHGSAIKGLV